MKIRTSCLTALTAMLILTGNIAFADAINVLDPISTNIANILLLRLDSTNSPSAGTTPDESGNGFNGVLYGGSVIGLPQLVEGKVTNSFYFSGGSVSNILSNKGNFLRIGDSGIDSLLDLSTNSAPNGFTIGCWVNFKDFTDRGYYYIVDKYKVGPGGYRLWLTHGTGSSSVTIRFNTSGVNPTNSLLTLTKEASTTVTWNTNQWKYIAVTFDNTTGGDVTFWDNGSKVGVSTSSVAVKDHNMPLYVGERLVSSYGGFHGNIDELFIADGVHTFVNEPESQSIDIRFPVSNEVADIIHWHFDSTNEPSSGYTPDMSDNLLHGRLDDGATTNLPQLVAGLPESLVGHTEFNGAFSFDKGTNNLVLKGPCVIRFDSDTDILRLSTNFITSGFTLGFWVRLDYFTTGAQEWNKIIDKHRSGVNGGGYEIGLYKNSSGQYKVQFVVHRGLTNGTTQLYTDYLPEFQDGKWHHIGLSYENTTNGLATVWYDGVSNYTAVLEGPIAAPAANRRDFHFGERGVGGYNKFIGSIDEFFIARGVHTFYKSEIPPRGSIIIIH